MKLNYYLIFIFLVLVSCNKNDEAKMTEESKKYTEDYFFKNNFKVEMLDFKLNNYKELNIEETDSTIIQLSQSKLLDVAIKLSNYTANDFLAMDGMWRVGFIKDAAKTEEYINYNQVLKNSMGQNSYEVHVYSKYITMDQNGNNKTNHLYDDRIYLLNKDYVVLGILK